MGLGSIVNSVVDKARDVVRSGENLVKDTVRTTAKVAPTVSQFSSVSNNIAGRLLGNDPISDITRKAVDTAQDLVAPATRSVSKGLFGKIADFGRGLLDRGSGFLKGVADVGRNIINRVVDSGRSIFNGLVEGGTGFVRSVIEGGGQILKGIGQTLNPAPFGKLFQSDFSGAWNDFKNNFTNGLSNIGGGLVKGTIQAVFDTGVVALSNGVSTVQTLLGLEPPSRGLNQNEIAELQKVYGDSIDYSQIRLKEGHLGIANGLAPHTVGNTIYIPKGWLDPNNANYQQNRNELLTHETAHVWQYQNGGTDYIGESLWNQALGAISGQSRNAAYEFETPIRNGKSWSELNPEQQAHLIEEAYNQNLFTDPNARFVYNGNDYTDYARNAIAEMRAGRGAP